MSRKQLSLAGAAVWLCITGWGCFGPIEFVEQAAEGNSPATSVNAASPNSSDKLTIPAANRWNVNSKSPQRLRLEAALEERHEGIQLGDHPLETALEYVLREQYDIAYVLDDEAVRSEGIGTDTPLKWDTPADITVASALDIALRDVGGVRLDYLLSDGYLFITTATRAEETLETVTYDLRPLHRALHPNLVAHIIQEESSGRWIDDGLGEGTWSAFPDGLVIRQTQRVHRDIELLLDQLAEHVRRGQNSGLPPWQPHSGFEGYLDRSLQ